MELNEQLDNLIIHGLIQEAEQDDADFEAAMRLIGDADFDGIVYDSEMTTSKLSFSYMPRPSIAACASAPSMCEAYDDGLFDDDEEVSAPAPTPASTPKRHTGCIVIGIFAAIIIFAICVYILMKFGIRI